MSDPESKPWHGDPLPSAPYPFYSGFPPHQHHSDTSYDAAAKIMASAGTLRAGILNLLLEWGPMTADQIQDFTGLCGSTVRPRLCELRKSRLIRDSGKRRMTRLERRAVVHTAITPTGHPIGGSGYNRVS